jgi:2-methylisocitrate lyase-like PEP mutase family enzyme
VSDPPLKRAVAERRLLVVPGAYDALSALLIERTGFDTMFVGGFPVAGATGARGGFDCTKPFGKSDSAEFTVPHPP